MAFFGGEDTVDGGWVSSPKRAVLCFFGGGIFGGMGIDALEDIEDMGFWGFGLGGMKEIKKSGGGDVRAEALAWDDEWNKT